MPPTTSPGVCSPCCFHVLIQLPPWDQLSRLMTYALLGPERCEELQLSRHALCVTHRGLSPRHGHTSLFSFFFLFIQSASSFFPPQTHLLLILFILPLAHRSYCSCLTSLTPLSSSLRPRAPCPFISSLSKPYPPSFPASPSSFVPPFLSLLPTPPQ